LIHNDTMRTPGVATDRKPLLDATLLLIGLTVLRLLVQFVPVPLDLVPTTSLIVSMIFVGLPIAAIFRASAFAWQVKSSLIALLFGLALQFGLAFVAPMFVSGVGAVLHGISQAGLVVWTLGLGALLSQVISDKNLIVPIAIFLALFDVWLVFVPEGPVGQIARGNNTALASVAYQLPRPTNVPTDGRAMPLAYVGPADFLFMAMFFALLHRFNLRIRQTAIWLTPVLICYLLTTLLFGSVRIGPISLGALPALLPIGAVVLAVNCREFKFTAEEKMTTVVLTVVCLSVLAWRFSVQPTKLPTAPSKKERGLKHSKSMRLPAKVEQGQSR